MSMGIKTREQLEASFSNSAPDWWVNVVARRGRKNRYVCSVNRLHVIITVDRDAGATPAMISCGQRFEPEGCLGHMRSRFYNANQNATPGWEWYRPEAVDGRFGKNAAQHEHVMNGGLVLRPLPEQPTTIRAPFAQAYPDLLNPVSGFSQL